MERVILVNENDKERGIEEKIKVHKKGLLHRAFSVLIFNDKKEILLQKRAREKPFPSLWSNACCSHPRPGENLLEAAKRRLKEEMGIETELFEVFSFKYKAQWEDYIENEIDHVFYGKFTGTPKINEKEVEEFKWIKVQDLKRDIVKNPENYTPWFLEILKNAEKFKKILQKEESRN
jgi:isopentenyl-diphosphate delta-isomerase